MTRIAAAIRKLAHDRSNAVTEWTWKTYVIRYYAGFVAWRRKWEREYPIGMDAMVFLEELER